MATLEPAKRTKEIAGVTFVLEDMETLDCDHEFSSKIYENIPVNPRGEYVRGYGTTPVFVRKEIGQRCIKCGIIRYYGN